MSSINVLPAEVLEASLRTLRHAKSEIRTTDLMRLAGRARGEALEQKLEQIAFEALFRRKTMLEEHRRRRTHGEAITPLKDIPRFANGKHNWREASEAPLFVAKRARALAELLYAERVLAEYEDDAPRFVAALLRDGLPEFANLLRAVGIAAREIRKVGLASRLLELNVCGAVLPYRDLLGGKLIALAAGSAEAAVAYASRYRRQHSEIASQMAGKAIYRDPSVCVISTTSLYGVVSSQYNRLKLHLEDDKFLNWQEIRRPEDQVAWTAGMGTGHFSDDTVQALRDLTIERSNRRKVNNIFGEGQSPRLRQVREGLAELRLDPQVYLRHSMPRRVYGLELLPGARRTLCLNQPERGTRIPFDEIAKGWRTRWLEPRIAKPDVLARVAESGPESVRFELTALETGPQRSLFPIVDGRGATAPQSAQQAPDQIILREKKGNLGEK